MQSKTTYPGILWQLQRFTASMAARITEVLHLKPSRAQSQTQQLQAALAEKPRPAPLLRKGLQQPYGLPSERLTEFGVTGCLAPKGSHLNSPVL